MFCLKCGTQIEEGVKFCEKCGQRVEATKVSTQTVGGRKKYLLGGAVTIILFILAFLVFRSLGQEIISPSPDLSNQDSSSRAELIADTVREIKSTTALPSQMDEVTIWNDVTAQPNAIRYHYTLVDADTSNLSNSYLKSYLRQSLCSNQDTRYILDQGIGMEYSYIVQGSTQSYFISFTKADCL